MTASILLKQIHKCIYLSMKRWGTVPQKVLTEVIHCKWKLQVSKLLSPSGDCPGPDTSERTEGLKITSTFFTLPPLHCRSTQPPPKLQMVIEPPVLHYLEYFCSHYTLLHSVVITITQRSPSPILIKNPSQQKGNGAIWVDVIRKVKDPIFKHTKGDHRRIIEWTSILCSYYDH